MSPPNGLGVRRAQGAMAYLTARGYRIGDEVYDPNQKPAPLFGGQPVSFPWIVGVGVIEFLETAPAS